LVVTGSWYCWPRSSSRRTRPRLPKPFMLLSKDSQ
jgi:hypothetical protein